MDAQYLLHSVLPALVALATVWVKLNKVKKDHDERLEKLTAWRTRKDEADKRHDEELQRLRAQLRDIEVRNRETNQRIFEKLDAMAEDVAAIKATLASMNGRR